MAVFTSEFKFLEKGGSPQRGMNDRGFNMRLNIAFTAQKNSYSLNQQEDFDHR